MRIRRIFHRATNDYNHDDEKNKIVKKRDIGNIIGILKNGVMYASESKVRAQMQRQCKNKQWQFQVNKSTKISKILT